jgi:ribonuclease HII
MELIIGIDDAGRGPIIGPMVLAGVFISKEDEKELKEWGVDDSKKLTAEKREEIFEKIKGKFEYRVELTSVDEIDSRSKMGTNLNRLEAVKAANIINELVRGKEGKIKIVIDCPSTNIEAWENCVKQYVAQEKLEKLEFFVEHKADANHISVGAASIVAKVTRDREIEKLKKEVGFDFGSGYPSDPFTCRALETRLDELVKKGIVRKTWATYDNLKAKKEQKSLF